MGDSTDRNLMYEACSCLMVGHTVQVDSPRPRVFTLDPALAFSA